MFRRWRGTLREWLDWLWKEIRNPERDTTEWDLVKAVPQRRSLTPRSISRARDKGKGRK